MYRILAAATAAVMIAPLGAAAAADYPSDEISNDLVHLKIYLPDAHHGFYRGTRFDWSGVIYSLQANGHNYYGPWFNKTDPSVHDFVYRGADIVAGPCSAITGPVDEFGPVGYEEAKAGGTFVKIGIGALRKSGDEEYDNYHLYEVADGGRWTVQKQPGKLEFIQHLNDTGSGYAYVYEKDVRLTSDKTEMVLEHRLKNVGKRAIQTSVYNHNFLVLDQQGPGAGVSISVPFGIRTAQPPDKNLAEVQGRQIRYLKALKGKDVVATELEGFSSDPKDNHVRVENSSLGAGLSFQTDRPLLHEALWSIRTVLAMEPFISVSLAPGAEFHWTTVYDYYTLRKSTE